MTRRALAAALGASLCACVGPFSEDFESHYEDVAAAKRDGAFHRGWLPPFIPGEAIDIWEMHNIDTNLTWACFTTPEGPTSTRTLLQEGGAIPASGPISAGPRVFFATREWWPSSMGSTEIEAYQLKENSRFTLLIGVDEAARRVCFHRS